MKKIILLLILISYGLGILTVTSQGICSCDQLIYTNDCNNMPGCTWNQNINSCSTIGCSTYTKQEQCLAASKYCQWNVGPQTCTTFVGCSSIIITSQTNYYWCGVSNLQCLSYNGFTCQDIGSSRFSLVCSDYTDTCTGNYGTDGVCLYNKQKKVCEPITQCNQVTQQPLCEYLNKANGLACQYINSQCTQITGCNQFNSESTCKYYFPNLNSASMILCQWTQSLQCVQAQNSLYLNSQNCLLSTGYNYRWLPTASNPNNGICSTCSVNQIPKLTVISKTQCQCQQFINQDDCNNNYCQWNQTTNLCNQITCTSVLSQSICITLQYCYWDYQLTGTCVQFNQNNQCTNLPITINAQICMAQNIYCPGFSNGQCQDASSLNTCSTSTNMNGCQNMIGSDGICKWINNICLPLQNCQQISDSVYCQSLQNLCQWNASLQLCQTLTCSSYNKNPSKCKYVISGFQETEYQLCKYNNITHNCLYIESAIGLTQENCTVNTANTYRWSSVSKVGMCIPCYQQLIQLQTNQSCQCSQFYNESDCINSEYCQYNNGICIIQQCSNILNTTLCASTTYCYWNPQVGCSNFTGCANLKASSVLECLFQNMQCKGFSDGYCYSNPQFQYCYFQKKQCIANYQDIDIHGINFYGQISLCYQQGSECQLIKDCTLANNQQCQMKELSISCYWNTQSQTCQQISCSNFQSKKKCKFYNKQPFSTEIISCKWNINNQLCETEQNILIKLNSETCSINTNNTYRWVPTQNGNGYCIKCQQQQQVFQYKIQNQCPCNYLISQYDCQQAIECNWQQNRCVINQCSSITTQNLCLSQSQCFWQSNICQDFNFSCSQLIGSTQLECINQQITCIGTNGINCTNQLTSCQQNLTIDGCIEQIGSDGFCIWNSNTQICESISECSQLPQQICQSKFNACYYNDSSCQQINCSQLYINTGLCDYVMSLSNQFQIQSCVLQNGICSEVTNTSQLNEETCYANFVGTTRWIPFQVTDPTQNSGTCQICSRTLIPTFGIEKCSCYQFITQNDCQTASNTCGWSNNNNSCIPISCTSITDQIVCSTSDGCAWDQQNNNCSYFISCNQVTGTSLTLQNCLIYSTRCRGFNEQNCLDNPTKTCQNYSESMCHDIIGIDGPCYYNLQLAQCCAIISCSNITNKNICSFQDHICNWNNGQCQNITCSNIINQNECTYVITEFLSGKIQLCQWNNNICSNLYSANNLTQTNCTQNTDFTYRWIPQSQTNINDGYCIKCVVNQIYKTGQCSCQQIYNPFECNQNSYCAWINYKCTNQICTSIQSQYDCSINPNCMWSLSQNSCMQFTNCNAISSLNNIGCQSQSINCQAQSSITASQPCQYLQNTNQCNQLTITTCENSSLPNLICVWNQSKSSCSQLTNCDQITSYQLCMNLFKQCVWKTPSQLTSSCQQTSCEFLTKQNCHYYFTDFANQKIQSCYWSDQQNVCISTTQPEIQLNFENCYTNSMMSYRWSSTNEIGLCISCQQQQSIQLSTKQICNCNLLSQSECKIASPFCNFQNGTCLDTTNCNDILDGLLCSQLKKCMWLNNSCQQFTNCSAIQKITTPLGCQQFSYNCPVYSSNQCQPYIQCDTFTTSSSCLAQNSLIANNYCFWNGTQCQIISACSQITDANLCNLQQYKCLWNQNTCVLYTCSNFKTIESCQFIYNTFQEGDITLCQWNYENKTCFASQTSDNDVLAYQDIDCYVKTAHTYYYNGTSCVQCEDSQYVLVFIVNLFTFAWMT